MEKKHFEKLFVWDFTGTLACLPFLYKAFETPDDRKGHPNALFELHRICWRKFCCDMDISILTDKQIQELRFDYKKASEVLKLDEDFLQRCLEKIQFDLKQDHVFIPGMLHVLRYIKNKGWGNIMITGGSPLEDSKNEFVQNKHLFEEFDGSIYENGGYTHLGKEDLRVKGLINEKFDYDKLIVIGDSDVEMQMAKNLKADEVFLIGSAGTHSNLPDELKPETICGEEIPPKGMSKRTFRNGNQFLPIVQAMAPRPYPRVCPVFLQSLKANTKL